MLLRIVNSIDLRREMLTPDGIEIPAVHRCDKVKRENFHILLGHFDDVHFTASKARHDATLVEAEWTLCRVLLRVRC